MPDTINTLSCIVSKSNTGFGRCNFLPGLIKMAIFVPKGYFILGTDDAYTQLAADIMNDNAGARVYPLGQFINFTDQATAAGTQSFNYGTSLTTNDGVPKWLFQILNGSHCLYETMVAAFSRQQAQYDVFFIDSNNFLIGVQTTVTQSDVAKDALRGFSMEEIYVPNWSPANSSAVPKYEISFTFGSTLQYRNNLAFIELSDDGLDNFSGLQTVVLSSAILDDNTWGITALENCTNTNIGERYGDTFAATDLWSAVNATTGGSITITSVGYNPTTEQYEILLNASDPDYPAIGDPIYINLIPPTELYGLAAVLYEGVKVTVLANT